MNMLMNATQTQTVTMTSLELVEFITSQRKEGDAILTHADFLKKVPKVLGGGEGKFSDTYIHPQNRQTYPCYVFPKREACLMAMSYSYDLQAVVYDRMTELENQHSLPTNYIEALEQLLISKKSEQQANERLAIAAPKVSYFDAVVDREHLLNATQVAQKLKLSAVALNRKLDEIGVYNKAVKSSRVFQQWFVDKGYGLVRQTEMGYPQAMFTLSGEAWVVGKLISEGEI